MSSATLHHRQPHERRFSIALAAVDELGALSHSDPRMGTPSKKLRVTVAVIVGALLIAALVTFPLSSELYRIGKVRDQYRLDDAVHSEVISNLKVNGNRQKAEYILDPPFMKRYNLSMSDYRDANGYFAPTGVHWAKWGLETKTAAILMWRQRSDISAWEIRRAIRLIDDYYSRNEQTIPVAKVVTATTKL